MRRMLVFVLLQLAACTTEPPPVLGGVPAFALTDQAGRPFASEKLRGKVWIANFIFTRCPTICPAFSAKMRQVQNRSQGFGPGLQLISFSVDPEYDTPERLKAYGARFRADFDRWSLLTGPLQAIELTVTEGMKIGMGRGADPNDIAAIFHGTYFVLVDRDMRIRGYYEFNSATAIQEILRDARILLSGPT